MTVPDAAGVEQIEFEHNVNSVECDETGNPPRITYRADTKTVTITGCLWVGSGTCKRPALERTEYREDQHQLKVVIGHTEIENLPEACNAAIATETYEVTIYLERSPVSRLLVVEDDVRGKTSEVAFTFENSTTSAAEST